LKASQNGRDASAGGSSLRVLAPLEYLSLKKIGGSPGAVGSLGMVVILVGLPHTMLPQGFIRSGRHTRVFDPSPRRQRRRDPYRGRAAAGDQILWGRMRLSGRIPTNITVPVPVSSLPDAKAQELVNLLFRKFDAECPPASRGHGFVGVDVHRTSKVRDKRKIGPWHTSLALEEPGLLILANLLPQFAGVREYARPAWLP